MPGNGSNIPVFHPPGGGNYPSGSGTDTTTGTGSSTGSGTGGGGGGGGGGGSSYSHQMHRAANSYMQQANMLSGQARALQRALNGGFLKALEQRLANVRLLWRQQDATLMENYHDRLTDLKGARNDNNAATADQSQANAMNMRRERANALSEAMAQGAGESDVLRSQQMSLRNWDANQSEIQRSYFDTLRSINTNLTDLNSDTKTGRQNVAIESLGDIESYWNDYYAQTSQAYTDLGNIYGQQATLYSQSGQYGGKGAGKKFKHSAHLAQQAFEHATDQIGQAWDNPGIPRRLRRWDGHDEFGSATNLSQYHDAPTNIAPPKPEGATLREWG